MGFQKAYSFLFGKKFTEAEKETFEKEAMEKQGCAWCKHCKAYVNWWCTNEEAKKARGTAIAGVIKCPYFKFDPDKIQWEK